MYRQKANNLATILPLVSADLVEGKADMDIKNIGTIVNL